jgi:hypothetical protein
MVYFKTKNPKFGIEGGKCLYMLWTFGILFGHLGKFYDHLIHFVLTRYIFSGLGITHQEKSGNPAPYLPRNKLRLCGL